MFQRGGFLPWSPERSVKGVREKGYICWRKTNFPWKAHQNSQTNYIIVSISEALKKKVAFCSWNLNVVQEPQTCRKVWEARVHPSRFWLTCWPQWRPLFSPLSHTLPDPAWLGLTKKGGHGNPEHPKKSWYTFQLWLCLKTETGSENHKRDWKARKIWAFPSGSSLECSLECLPVRVEQCFGKCAAEGIIPDEIETGYRRFYLINLGTIHSPPALSTLGF